MLKLIEATKALRGVVLTITLLCFTTLSAWAQLDSVYLLPDLTVTAQQHREVIPGLKLEGKQLQKLSSISIADAVRYFSGIQIKDYGGLGGLKTVDVRGMGTNHLGVFYNGIKLGNAQNGQIDLGKFSLDNVEAVSLYNGQKSDLFQPAQHFASASSIYIETRQPTFSKGKHTNLRAHLRAGSFATVIPSVLVEQKLPNDFALSANVEFVSSSGKYPFRYKRIFEDGTIAYDTVAVRQNGDITALRAELALFKKMEEGKWDLQGYYYHSKRGLPGPIIRNVFQHGQRLEDQNFFFQGKLTKKVNEWYSIQAQAKYANDYTRYLDEEWTSPLYVDNKYEQHEVYATIAQEFIATKWLRFGLSTDARYNTLNANLVNFSYPKRLTLMGVVSGEVSFPWITFQAALLGTIVRESVERNVGAPPKNVLTPSFFLSLKPFKKVDLKVHTFYKNIFRMPTFNDLYYTFIGNAVLRPEYAEQYDFGISYRWRPKGSSVVKYADARVESYFNKIKDKIVAVPAGNMFRWTMLNLGKVDIFGTEANLDLAVEPIEQLVTTLRLSYTYEKALDVTSPKAKNYRHQIVYIPEHSGSVIAGAEYKSWGLNYSFIYTGKRYNAKYNDENSRMLPWYTHDISLRKDFLFGKKHLLRINLDVNNLLNQHYDVVINYPMPGRNYKLTLTYQL